MKFSDNIDISEDRIILKTEYSFIFVNIRPFLPYHILISPKRIVKQMVQLNKEELNDLFETAQRSMKALSFYSEDFTLNVQDGVAAGQTVPHLHIHLIPRLNKDLPVNNEIYREGSLQTNIDDEGKIRTNRTLSEMSEEVKFLRPKFQKVFNNL